jgi:hypothetical protein
VGKPEEERPLGSVRHIWKDWNRMDGGEICFWGGVDSVGLG